MKDSFRTSFFLSRWWLLGTLPALTGSVWFCVYYLTNSYDRLLEDFRRAHGCFYRNEVFATQYFSPATKAAGNNWCIAALVVSGLLLLALGYCFRKKAGLRVSVVLVRKEGWALALLGMLALGAWLWGGVQAPPAYDEVFSAINIAGEGPALSIRYYMLPNNHMLFNILNSMLPGDGGDKVFTGRLLSGFAHLGTAAVLYGWMRQRALSVGWAFCFTAVVLLFYPVWAFSFQARGYSGYLFCCWAAIVSLDGYFRSRASWLLAVHLLAGILGFAIVPAYLYWHLGICVYTLTYWPVLRREKQLAIRLLQLQLVLAGAVFLFYLPGLATSGLPAFTQNPYVTPSADTLPAFFRIFLAAMNSTVRYSFASDVDGESLLYPVAFLLPVLAWPLCRSREGRRAVLQFAIFWLVFCGMQLGLTRRWPFMRNMIAHCSLFAAVFLVGFHYAAAGVGERLRLRPAIPCVLTALLLVVTAVHYLRFMKDHLNDLYYNNLAESYRGPAALVDAIPADARVWYSDESFFPHFLLQQKALFASHCASGADYNYFVLDHRTEVLPAALQGIPVRELYRDQQYVLYKRE